MQAATASTARSQDPLAQKFAAEQAAQKRENPTTTAQTASTPKPTSTAAASTATPAAKYVVRSNESLWGIASRIATEQNRPVSEVMQQIKNSNEHAFIQGDVNRLRRGAALNLHGMQQAKQPVKVSAAELAKVPSKQSGKTKYRLNQAEMSLVAEKAQDSAQSSANSAAEKNKTSKELSLKVMTSREKTVKLQRNVTQLELALNQKDHRIQLLNARLAQLQQQLKAQQADKRSQ
jgi:Tfp pilus assembly protein FimV